MSKTDTIARMSRDGALRRRRADGADEPMADATPTAKSDAEIEVAALADPDNPPLTPEREAQLKPVPRLKTLRRALGLTQEEFAARYRIPVGTLRDWEQGRSEPDQAGRNFLLLIARDPTGVAIALQSAA